jgi:mono/diheme cytochrome c family protein
MTPFSASFAPSVSGAANGANITDSVKTTLVLAVALLIAAIVARNDDVAAQAQAPRATSPSAAAAFTQYCVTCHNTRLKTAGFVLDPAGLSDVGAGAETWEKVVRKLRARAMPPAGVPRPDTTIYDSVATFVETELDRASIAHPQLGKLPLVHRLTRTEYQNAVRDLLAVEALPNEVRIDLLLPPDNISSGFDNIADLLFVSPSNMERYLDAARKVARLAVGDPAMPVLVNIHKLEAEHPQDERVDDLPFGTRGGLAVRSEFPVDGRYVVKVDLAGGSRERHDLEVTVDGARAAVRTVGDETPEGGRGRGRGRGAASAAPLEFPLSLKAGPKVIGVSFVQHTEARDESTLRPRMRSRGTQPAIASVTISGPYDVKAPGDSPSRKRIFVCRPTAPANELSSASATASARSRRRSQDIQASEDGCARQILSALARRAYRHPIVEADLRDLLPFFETGRKEGGFDRGIQKAIERLLVSSQFLFRIERPSSTVAPGAVYRVSDLELASRLSFFLWSSIPDDELLDAAVAGRLKDSKVLDAQVRRMLADPRSESLVTNFAAQWLFLRDIDSKRPDEILFPNFDETLRDALRRETELFIDSIFRENRNVTELLTANYTFLNERLARHYGIPNIKGSYFRRVTLPDSNVRGGLLGQGSILTLTSYSTRTSPVLRGKWVLENLLSSAPPPPPPDIPALRTEAASTGKPLTMREAMAQHRANPSCAGCHARMDPIGFSMENLDAVGAWRDLDGFNAIDAVGVFPDGTKFDGVAGLKKELLRQSDQFVMTVAEKLLMYAVGRNLQYYDAPAVRAVLREAGANGNTMPALMMAVVKSRPFQMRQASE